MAADYTLRPATRADLAAMANVDRLIDAEPGRAEHVGGLLDLGMSWLAESQGAVAGFMVVSDHFYGFPFVDLLVVDEAHRRRGLGGALMEMAEEGHHRDRLFTSTNESNAPMRALLAGRGYQVSGIIENLDAGDPEVVFVKFRQDVAPAG